MTWWPRPGSATVARAAAPVAWVPLNAAPVSPASAYAGRVVAIPMVHLDPVLPSRAPGGPGPAGYEPTAAYGPAGHPPAPNPADLGLIGGHNGQIADISARSTGRGRRQRAVVAGAGAAAVAVAALVVGGIVLAGRGADNVPTSAAQNTDPNAAPTRPAIVAVTPSADPIPEPAAETPSPPASPRPQDTSPATVEPTDPGWTAPPEPPPGQPGRPTSTAAIQIDDPDLGPLPGIGDLMPTMPPAG